MKKLFTITPEKLGYGQTLFAWQPKSSGALLACSGEGISSVLLFDRKGRQINELPLPDAVLVKNLQWDKDGEILAITLHGQPSVLLWVPGVEGQLDRVDTLGKEPSVITWSKTGPHLAIGTAKGGLVLYDKRTRKHLVITGAHSRDITCGIWTSANTLALGGGDRQITLSNSEGQTLGRASVQLEPTQLDVSFVGASNNSSRNMVSAVLGNQTLLIIDVADFENPVELAFKNKYGDLKMHQWIGCRIILGFANGYVVVISSNKKEMTEKLQSIKLFSNTLDGICCNISLQKAVAAGDGVLKVLNMCDWREIKNESTSLELQLATVTQMHWSPDGQLLTIATNKGYVICYLMKLPTLSTSYQSSILSMTSLTEFSIFDAPCVGPPKIIITCEVEPSIVSLGPRHCAVGLNNCVWYYFCDDKLRYKLVNQQQYMGSVENISLGTEHAAVQLDGRINLHAIEKGVSGSHHQLLPWKAVDGFVVSASIVGSFLIYICPRNVLKFYSIEDASDICEYAHSESLRHFFPNANGTQVVIIDDLGVGLLFNPITCECVGIPSFPESTKQILWDMTNIDVFICQTSEHLFTFLHVPESPEGQRIEKVGSLSLFQTIDTDPNACVTEFAKDNLALVLKEGYVTFQKPDGSLCNLRLETHSSLCKYELEMPLRNKIKLSRSDPLVSDIHLARIKQCLALNLLQESFVAALAMGVTVPADVWEAIALRSLSCLDIKMANKAFRQLGVPSKVIWAEKLQYLEEKLLLCGHICGKTNHLHMHAHFYILKQRGRTSPGFSLACNDAVKLKNAKKAESKTSFVAVQHYLKKLAVARQNRIVDPSLVQRMFFDCVAWREKQDAKTRET